VQLATNSRVKKLSMSTSLSLKRNIGYDMEDEEVEAARKKLRNTSISVSEVQAEAIREQDIVMQSEETAPTN
jgi:hypothetical protein